MKFVNAFISIWFLGMVLFYLFKSDMLNSIYWLVLYAIHILGVKLDAILERLK